MKNEKYHPVGTIPRSNIKIVETDKTDSPKTRIHGRSYSWLGTDTTVKKWRS